MNTAGGGGGDGRVLSPPLFFLTSRTDKFRGIQLRRSQIVLDAAGGLSKHTVGLAASRHRPSDRVVRDRAALCPQSAFPRAFRGGRPEHREVKKSPPFSVGLPSPSAFVRLTYLRSSELLVLVVDYPSPDELARCCTATRRCYNAGCHGWTQLYRRSNLPSPPCRSCLCYPCLTTHRCSRCSSTGSDRHLPYAILRP
jgi:hypothetical protein